MARSVAEAVLATAVFLITMSLIITGQSFPPAVFGSYFLGGITTLIAGVSLGVAFYQWDGFLHIFQAEEHVTNPEGLMPKVSSIIVNMAGIISIIGIISIGYSLLAALI